MDMNKYKELFSSSVKEKLDEIASLTVTLEKEPRNQSVINDIFRSAHSIKGMAATMGYSKMSKLSHSLENLFDKVRKGEILINEALADIILKVHEILSDMLTKIVKESNDEVDSEHILKVIADAIKGKISEKDTVKSTSSQRARDSIKDPFVKVKASYLDRLIDIVSEFISLRSRLVEIRSSMDEMSLGSEIDHLGRLIRDMNEKILSMRMLPIDVLSGNLPRTVREISRSLGKSCEIEISGESIELDKNIIDSLESSVIHIIRNCLDHGLETPDERKSLGKSPKGNIFFKAFRFQNRVIIEIGDDGRGINLEKVEQKALERGILQQIDIDLMEPERRYLLICAPGISTHEDVSEVSGRGVGMDVVKSSIESLGGMLSIFSGEGMGTTFRIDLPLTAAIIKVFKVGVEGVLYGIPSISIQSIDEISPNAIVDDSGIEYYDLPEDDEGAKVEIINLSKALGGYKRRPKPVERIVILRGLRRRAALCVDDLFGMEEVIVKPLSVILKSIRGISGVTILSNGKPMFILNPEELA